MDVYNALIIDIDELTLVGERKTKFINAYTDKSIVQILVLTEQTYDLFIQNNYIGRFKSSRFQLKNKCQVYCEILDLE